MPQDEAEKRKKPYPVRFAPEELEAIRAKAEAAGLPLGTYIREAALDHKVAGKGYQKVIAQLSKLGGLQKHLFTEGGAQAGPYGSTYRMILLEILQAVRRIENEARPE